MARKIAPKTLITFLLPGTAGLAIGLDEMAERTGGLDYDVRGARYGVSYIVTATPEAAQTVLAAVEKRAAPDFPRGEGQPSSWGHGCRKALHRIRAAIKVAGK